MKRGLPAPTAAERARFRRLQEIGCLCCRIAHDFHFSPCEIHHLLSGGIARGHRYTLGLCPWHHRGVPPGDSPEWARHTLGPSLMDGSRTFHAHYGSDEELLRVQDGLIDVRALAH